MPGEAKAFNTLDLPAKIEYFLADSDNFWLSNFYNPVTCKTKLFTNIVSDFQSLFIFANKIPFYMFVRVMNTPPVLLDNMFEYLDAENPSLSRTDSKR